MTEPPRTRFGKYFIESKIAVGGMSEIYRGVTSTGETVAIKLIHPNYASQQKFIQMFLDEASIVINLRHPNIVPLLDFGKVDETYYFSMEWIDGRALSTILKKQYESRISFPVEVALLIMIDLCEGLAYAHSRNDRFNRPLGIVHRDVSPPNILISRDSISKIADFGIADARNKGAQTQPGIIRGKFSYMSPEQTFAEPIDHRSDLFSSGVVLWETLAGRRLFLRDSDPETVTAVRRCEIPSLQGLRRDVPASVEKVILKALSKKRERRHRDSAEFAADLRRVLKKEYPMASRQSVAEFLNTLFPGDDFHVDPSKEIILSGSVESPAFRVPDWKEFCLDHRWWVSAGLAALCILAAQFF